MTEVMGTKKGTGDGTGGPMEVLNHHMVPLKLILHC